MAITTIITTYRRPILLKRAINSVLKQTHPDFQICIYDNASDDQTQEIVHGFAKKDSRVKYHCHSNNIGIMPNYKYALDRVDSPFFSLLSDDDFLLPEFYETALKGLLQFPDAAFSACGIAQLDEKGNFVGDPLSRWESEGYYLPHQGLIEMIKTRWRFPIPTGILFNRRIIKDITPNFSKDIDFFWDPDYLIRIIAKFPAVITKKCCGVYLAHGQSFSYSFYSKLLDDISIGEKYLKALRIVKRGIEENNDLKVSYLRTAIRLFNDYVKQDVIFFIKIYIDHRKFGGAHFLSKKYYSYFGLSWIVGFYHLTAIVKAIALFSVKAILGQSLAKQLNKYLTSIKKYLHTSAVHGKYLIKKILKKSSHGEVKLSGLENFREYHEYGQKLFDDNQEV